MSSFQKKKLNWEEAKGKTEDYPYALVYELSKVLFGRREDVAEKICWEECTEARFFGEDRELHLFEANGEKMAVEVWDGEQGEWILRAYELEGRFRKCGRWLKVKEYLEQDEDGQMVTVMTRLAGVSQGEET